MPADEGKDSSSTRTAKEKKAATADGRDDVFARGVAFGVPPAFAKEFATEATYLKTPLASVVKPFASFSSAALAQTRHPLVLVRVVDTTATPVPNVRLELFDANGTFVDAVASDSIGLGLLRFPSEPPGAGSPQVTGKVRVDGTQSQSVAVPAGDDFVVVHVELSRPSPAGDEGGDVPRDPVRPPPAGDEGGDAAHDSVIPRLPAFFSVRAADELLRHRGTADGPDPCFASAVDRQCTYRAPQVRWVYARRTVYQDSRVPRRLYVRIRQEWHFVGHSFGQPERIDSRDVAGIVGSLDANLGAQLAVAGRLGISTESVLGLDASGRLRAAASLEGELDASVGLNLFEGGLGNPLSVSGDADVSIETSLLVSAQLKLRASLRNRLQATASLTGRAAVGLEADASIGVNPSLSRELNIPRFVIHENYVVLSFVEDVQVIEEIKIFDDLNEVQPTQVPNFPFFPFPPLRPLLFPPADIVEYRPIFERRLLEPRLAGRFRALRNALDSAAGQGPLVRRVRFDVTYAATMSGTFQVELLGRSVKVKLTPGQSQARVAVDLPGGQFLNVLTGEKVDFHVSIGLGDLLTTGAGSVRITSITAFSDASPDGRSVSLSQGGPFEANMGQLTDSLPQRPLTLAMPDASLRTDPLVVHINRNRTYYMGLLVKAALANPSLRFDVPQLQRIGPDNVLWRLPIHGFAGNKALVLVPATGKAVQTLLGDLGRATVVQLAVDGNWSEAMQGKNVLADALGQLFPAIEGLELPTELLDGLTSGAGLVPAIVEAGAVAAGLGDAAGDVPTAGGGPLGSIAGILDV